MLDFQWVPGKICIFNLSQSCNSSLQLISINSSQVLSNLCMIMSSSILNDSFIISHFCQFSLLYTYAFCMNSIFHQKLHHVKTLSKIKTAKKCHWLGLIRKVTTEKFFKVFFIQLEAEGILYRSPDLIFASQGLRSARWVERIVTHG